MAATLVPATDIIKPAPINAEVEELERHWLWSDRHDGISDRVPED
jgi:hypothetical protein